jgi:hypothetical protein
VTENEGAALQYLGDFMTAWTARPRRTGGDVQPPIGADSQQARRADRESGIAPSEQLLSAQRFAAMRHDDK